jgi:hypothetical protein
VREVPESAAEINWKYEVRRSRDYDHGSPVSKRWLCFPLDAVSKLLIIRDKTRKLYLEMPMRGLAILGAIGSAACLLSGCNESARPVVAAPAPVPAGLSLAGLLQGAPCTKAIGTYQNIVQHDADTGNVNQSVYHEIEDEISQAVTACSAGREGEADALLQNSKAKHGYHA